MKTQSIPPVDSMPDEQLLDELQRRAVLYFWEAADQHTGLVKDRACNFDDDDYIAASIAATGYGLAALTIGVERGWLTRGEAETRASDTLRFLLSMPHERGWLMHWVDKRNGQRFWSSEYSSIDTALLVAGAIVCREYFSSNGAADEIALLVDSLYSRVDWRWMLTNGGAKPEKLVFSHGWRPENGFIGYDYGAYSEAILIYLLGLGAPLDPVPGTAWEAISRPIQSYQGIEFLKGGPIFIHQMPSGYFNFRNQRDRLGYDYWVSSTNAMNIHRQFCSDRAAESKTYAAGFWGLNASDGPEDYVAYGVIDAPNDGTVSPTGAISAITFVPILALSAARLLFERLQHVLWGRYGFVNAFNLDRDWYARDVIGIDLGMLLLSIENYRTGLIWTLMSSFYRTASALRAAGFHLTLELAPRPLFRAPADSVKG